jgi:cystathionine gamma-lyase/cystathionine gamma-lyase/homocysteine desulfhydrase
MVAQPYSGSHASLSESEKEDMDIGQDIVRLCFGLEDKEDLKADLENALRAL